MASFNELTPEQMEKARECKNTKDLVALAESEGIVSPMTSSKLSRVATGSTA